MKDNCLLVDRGKSVIPPYTIWVLPVMYRVTKWTAPCQLPLRPSPCDHGIETTEVPIDPKYQTEDAKAVIRKCCDMGHRWMGSKTVSDCVEALIGDFYVDCGLIGAIHCMKWLGVTCDLGPARINEAMEIASLHAYAPILDAIQILESKIGYEFVVKGLLLEAITHHDQGVGYCYQRLEFLGDSVLDILITWYLFKKHKDIDPGEFTDLRSASVNNENSAYAAVRRNLHPHLQYRSDSLRYHQRKNRSDDKRTAFNSFKADISVTIPDYVVIELTGDA